MLWLNPFALFALGVVAAPILIHLLVQPRAERFPFPTLRFLRPTRLAAIRRRTLEDLPLLAVRVALLAAAVAALAGPLLITAARRQAWDRRIVRAIVTDAAGASSQQAEHAPPLRQETFAAGPLADGIRRAILWLDTTPPARREIVIASPFPIGSITQADVAAIPAGIGVRLERSGTLPAVRTVPAGSVLTASGPRARDVTLTGDQTSVRDAAAREPMAWPIDVVSSKDDRPAIDAAVAAVLSQRVRAAPAGRRARVVFGQEIPVDAASITQPWMADAAARIARDPDLQHAAARVTAGLADPRLVAAPWQSLVAAGDGRPLAVAAGSASLLIVATASPASDVATPVLLRSIANAIATIPDLQGAEVVPIADAVLQQWSRPPAPVTSPRLETVDRDDRRWLWLAVLCLLALESWLRRARAEDVAQAHPEEPARVA
jgi:hypothetical protein